VPKITVHTQLLQLRAVEYQGIYGMFPLMTNFKQFPGSVAVRCGLAQMWQWCG